MLDKKYIASRISRSKETMAEAKLMFDNQHYLTVINRLYYAVFYLACAYLANIQIITKTHSGTKIQFNEAFIKTRIVDEAFGKLYSKLFKDRNDNDYGDFVALQKDEVLDLLIETDGLLNKYWAKFYN
ncbi:MAG: HEPN domain-containing protein [Deinococcales bacterium]|nr:HEPN domain-containing protein [Chitinophagaceae bacterium]